MHAMVVMTYIHGTQGTLEHALGKRELDASSAGIQFRDHDR